MMVRGGISAGATAVTAATSFSRNSCAEAAPAEASASTARRAGMVRISVDLVAPGIIGVDPPRAPLARVLILPPGRRRRLAPARLLLLHAGIVAPPRRLRVGAAALTLVAPDAGAVAVGAVAVARVARGIGLLGRHEAVLGLVEAALRVEAEMLDEGGAAAIGQAIAAAQVDRQVDELAACRRRGRRQRDLRHARGPGRLQDRLEDRDRDLGSGLARAEGTALAVGVVVADPDRDRDVVG